MEATIVLCTVPTDEHARRIARALVEERLAACVSILPGIRSIFRWQNNISDDPEFMLMIKTRRELYNRLFHRIQELHPYEVPEIIALGVTGASSAYLSWLQASTDPK
jgi:periplasmic divalent cation tolerance protein